MAKGIFEFEAQMNAVKLELKKFLKRPDVGFSIFKSFAGFRRVWVDHLMLGLRVTELRHSRLDLENIERDLSTFGATLRDDVERVSSKVRNLLEPNAIDEISEATIGLVEELEGVDMAIKLVKVIIYTRTTEEIFKSPFIQVFEVPYVKIIEATDDFDPLKIIGQGGFGAVYEGVMDDRSVAVKVPNPGANRRDWLAEVKFLGHLRHPNIVRLVGYCKEEMILVYEYLSERDLTSRLTLRRLHLTWEARIRVAIDIARGLAFLHREGIIFRDLKPGNILFDSDLNAKICDFGYATFSQGDDPDPNLFMYGTKGYRDPEYICTGRLSIKCDIYSFGVLLLELIVGAHYLRRKFLLHEEYKTVTWARQNRMDDPELSEDVDRMLNGQYSTAQVKLIYDLALRCMGDTADRPEIVEILSELEIISLGVIHQ